MQPEIGVDMHTHSYFDRHMHDAQMLQAIQTDVDSDTTKSSYQSTDTEGKE